MARKEPTFPRETFGYTLIGPTLATIALAVLYGRTVVQWIKELTQGLRLGGVFETGRPIPNLGLCYDDLSQMYRGIITAWIRP